MINKPDISSEGNLHKWLLITTMMFSLFSFSGCIGNTPNQEQQVFRTELVVANNLVVKSTILFNGTFKKFSANNITSIFSKIVIKNVLIVHNLLSKTRFDYISEHKFTFEHAEKFFQIRKTSQSSEEDLPHLFRG